MNPRIRRAAFASHVLFLCALPGVSFAADGFDAPSGDWTFRANVYAFVPEVGGHANIPSGGSLPLDVSASDLISHTDVAAMAGFEARKGRWGLYTDAVFMDLGQHNFGTRSLLAGRAPLPPGTSADLSLDIEALALTVAGTYRVHESDRNVVDVLAGGRMLDASVQLDWAFNADVAGTLRSGSREVGHTTWDGIVGLKGRSYFGDRNQWFVPWYVDAGTGAADLTWNASVGVGYAAHWGDVFVTYRRLDYDFSSDSTDSRRHIEDIHFNGPTLGVAFAW